MKLSTRTRYGLRAMVQLAAHEGDRPLGVSAIAAEQELSPKYLHSLMTSLKAAGLVRSVRGTRGGFLLKRDAGEISLDQVVQALEGSISLVDCVEQAGICGRAETCPPRDVWVGLATKLRQYLAEVSLQDLVSRQAKAAAPPTCTL